MKRAFWQRPFGKIVFGALSLLFVGVGGAWFHVHGEQMFHQGFDQKKPHHQTDRFVNLDPTQRPPSGSSLPKLLRIAFGTAEQGKHPAETASAQHKAQQLHRKPDSVTWLGHAAFQIRLKEANLLADPMLGPRASPF